MLIRDAQIHFAERVDLRIADGVIVEIAAALTPRAHEATFDAAGHAVIPGLHDHHLHFLATAAAQVSLFCGPPVINDERALREALRARAADIGMDEWLRGIGYHESVAGAIDRVWLDRAVAEIPVRIQHRSGRLWILNSRALACLGALNDSPLEKQNGEFTGRLYDADAWLRERIGRRLPDIGKASLRLARYGVTGFTDTSASNSVQSLAQFAQWRKSGELLQRIVLMGDALLNNVAGTPQVQRGALKIHLHENELPDIEVMCAAMVASHAVSRPVAVHCVTLVELLFTLSAFELAGSIDGDRIEHAAIAPPETIEKIAAMKLTVVTQPNFIAERGDAYRRDVEREDQPWLYRLRGFRDAGIALAAGTDAPYGDPNPWAAMQAAVTRRTESGGAIGADEALTPEQALALFLGDPLHPGNGDNRIEVGQPATVCVLDRPWEKARENLSQVAVRAVFIDGEPIVFDAQNE